jgi:esterase/lipase superfamily enzyme
MFTTTLRLFAAALAFLIAASITGCGSAGASRDKAAKAEPVARHVELFYATNRAAERSATPSFGTERGGMSYGFSRISIPPGHLMGRHEEPSLLKFEWSPQEHKHIKVLEVVELNRDDFVQRLNRAVEFSRGNKLMVFVHGYNETFSGASRVVAQFAHDLKFSGPVLLFSWPSQGRLTGYTVDATNAEWAQAHFLEMMGALLDNVPAKDIYLIGHSMGNRILGRGMATLASDRPPSDMLRFREIVMIAPDIDAEVFRRDLAPRLSRTGIHTTLYASSKDRAMRASKVFHGYTRAGESGEELVLVEGVETIDASDVSGGFIGHSYFAEDRRIMEDIFALLQTGERAEHRFGLQSVTTPQGRYWTLRK